MNYSGRVTTDVFEVWGWKNDTLQFLKRAKSFQDARDICEEYKNLYDMNTKILKKRVHI